MIRLCLVLLLTACSPGVVGQPLPDTAASRLQTAGDDPDALGRLIYEGQVRQRDGDGDPLFRYERRIVEVDDGWRATHLTFEGDRPVLMHQALYDDNGLLRFDEVHGQTGLVGSATVLASGDLSLKQQTGDDAQSSVESPTDPVQVGPTLFGFALRHWDSLVAGDAVRLRFVVLEDARTYGFTLRLVSTDAEKTVFRMRATSTVVQMAVPPMLLTFDTQARVPRQFEGLVPPMMGDPDALRKLDARVRYTMAAEWYE